MISKVISASDIRQSTDWSKYMQSIGWRTENANGTKIFIRKLPFLKYSMIKIEHPCGKLPFKRIDTVAKKHSALAVVIEPHNLTNPLKEYSQNGYRNSKLTFAHSATIKIDLERSENTIFSNLSENAKRNISKAYKNGLAVKQLDDPETFFKLMKNLEKIKKIYTLPRTEFYKKYTVFKDNSFLLFSFRKNSLKPCGAIWLSFYSGVITYMQTGITAEGYRMSANYLLVWEGIKLAKKSGMRVWDFDALYDARFPNQHKSWKGFSEFKSRFHGEIVEYPPPQIKIYNVVFKLIYLWATIFIK